MNLLQPLFLMPVLVGSIFILVGFITTMFPAKKINGLYGYRTKSSMEDQERWDFAQKYSSRVTLRAGLFILITCLLSFIIQLSETIEVFISLIIIVSSCIYIYYTTEKALKSHFKSTT